MDQDQDQDQDKDNEMQNNAVVENIPDLEDVKEVKEVNNKRKSKPSFNASCSRCHKAFKTKNAYDKHILQQMCYQPYELSYCKICDLSLCNHTEYTKHLMTMTHLTNIGCSKLDRLNDNRPSTVLTADPYLSQTEANLIGTNNLGEKYTFVYENNETQVVKLIHKPEPTKLTTTSSISSTSNLNGPQITKNKEPTPEQSIAPDRVIQPTTRQLKLLTLLERQTNVKDASNLFLKMIDNLLNIDDYYGMMGFIREHPRIASEYKNAFIEMSNKFVEGLTKMRASGQTTYKGKDITKVVVMLTM